MNSTTNTPLQRLLQRARTPLGASVQLDLQAAHGPLAELAELLSQHNGFTVFNAGVQVFHAGQSGVGPELRTWNEPTTWKDTYAGLADHLFCFGQDLFGRQFAITDNTDVVLFDPETAEQTHLGTSLSAWATWLLADPDVNGTDRYATAWQDHFGPLDHDQRLIPLRFFTLGGSYDVDNIVVKDATDCMRIRGPLAQRIHDHADGEQVRLVSDTPPAQPGQLAYAELDVFADYNSFFVQDNDVRFEPGREMTKALINDLIATEAGAIGVGTARRTTVPVVLDVRSEEPDQSFDGWDQVAEAGVRTDTGKLVVSMLDYRDKVPRITVPPGEYTARIYYRGLGTISSDGQFGDDLYKVVLWPGEVRAAMVMKRYQHPMPGG